MTEESDLIRGLWPLPGGNKHYLDTLNRALKWASSTDNVTDDDLAQWLIAQYNVSKNSAAGYARVILTLDALAAETGSDRLSLTRLGKAILDYEGEAKARVVAERFLEDYLGFREVLAIYNRRDVAIHLDELVERLQPYFVRWTSSAQYEYRALWLLSLGALTQKQGRYYQITEFGRRLAAEYPPLRDIDSQPPEPVSRLETEMIAERPTEVTDVTTALVHELEAAAVDSRNPERLEQAVAEAFEFLGFAVDHLGMSGETDVLVRANIGGESYTVVVDAKARNSGKVQNLDVYTLLDHKRQNEADHAMVVAGDFAGGKVVVHTRESGVTLMPVALLLQWLQLHAKTPLNLKTYQVMFATPGLMTELPDAVELAAQEQTSWSALLVDLMELISETYYEHGLSEALPRQNLFFMLMTRLRGVRYSKEEVEQAISLLAHPALGAMLVEEHSVSLAMNRSTLARVLRRLADRIESSETETVD